MPARLTALLERFLLIFPWVEPNSAIERLRVKPRHGLRHVDHLAPQSACSCSSRRLPCARIRQSYIRRPNIGIDDELVADALAATGLKTRREALWSSACGRSFN